MPPKMGLTGLLAKQTGEGTIDTALPKLVLHRATRPTAAIRQCTRPTLCIVVQGGKRAFVGDDSFYYDAANYIVSTIEMPLASAVVEATREQPYLGLALELDLVAVAEIARTIGGLANGPGHLCGVVRAPLEADLADALARYAGLLNRPEDVGFLAHGIECEIWYRLLRGPAGSAIAQLAFENSLLSRIGRATSMLREGYANPTRIADLVDASGMSRSAFHEAFRQVTGTTPLQYQKLVRLQEARRLLGTGTRTAAQAAFDVGYVSPSHFSRDYRRMFGMPPSRDAALLRIP